MTPFLTYLVNTLLCSAVLLMVHRQYTTGKADPQTCRRRLNASLVLSVLLPLLGSLGAWIQAGTLPENRLSPDSSLLAGLEGFCQGLLATGMLLLPLRTLRGLYRIGRLKRKSPGRNRLCLLPPGSPSFSFFRTVFLDSGLSKEERRIVLQHERSHLRHGHCIDRLLADILRPLTWFSPASEKLTRQLYLTHEFQADDDVLRSGVDPVRYAGLLLRLHRENSRKPGTPAARTPAPAFSGSFLHERICRLAGEPETTPGNSRKQVLAGATALLLIVCANFGGNPDTFLGANPGNSRGGILDNTGSAAPAPAVNPVSADLPSYSMKSPVPSAGELYQTGCLPEQSESRSLRLTYIL